jgi:hypothetical protein
MTNYRSEEVRELPCDDGILQGRHLPDLKGRFLQKVVVLVIAMAAIKVPTKWKIVEFRIDICQFRLPSDDLAVSRKLKVDHTRGLHSQTTGSNNLSLERVSIGS